MKRLILILQLTSFFSLQAQVTVDEFLNSAFHTPGLKSLTWQDNYLNERPYRLAPIQKLEFRTESNQLDPERQDYALRINPANPWEVKRNTQYFKTYQELVQLDYDRTLKAALKSRYEAIIEWQFLTKERQLKEDEKRSAEKMISIVEGQRHSALFDANDYVKLKLDQVETVIELEEALFKIDTHHSKIVSLLETARFKKIEWSYDQIISLDQLQVVVDSIAAQGVARGEVAYREKQITLATHEWELEKANINMGFLQAQYQPFRTEQGRTPWNLSLGVTIPVFNPNKGDMTKRKLEILEAQGDRDEAQQESLSGIESMKHKIKSLINRHHEVGTLITNQQTNSLSSTLQQLNDPAAVVRLQRNLTKLKSITIRLEKEILISYIEFLSYAEALQQRPVVNFLSPTLSKVVTGEEN